MSQDIVFALLVATLCTFPYAVMSFFCKRSINYIKCITIVLSVLGVMGAFSTGWKIYDYYYNAPQKLGDLKNDIVFLFLGCMGIIWASIAEAAQTYGPMTSEFIREIFKKNKK